MKNKLNSFIKLEIDNELIQGSVLEVEYEILFSNKSELDYNLESYYLYGRINSEQEKATLIKIKPSTIIDYLDKDWSYEESKNSDGRWVVKTKQELETGKLANENVIQHISELEIENKTILITDKLNKEFAPGESESISLNVSKILTVSRRIRIR